MPRLTSGFALLLAMHAAVPALAQDMLTLDGAIADALVRNRSLSAARSSTTEAGFAAEEARSPLFPTITVSESWQRGNQPVFVFSSLLSARRFAASNFAIDALNHPDPVGFFRTSVGVEQLLFDGGRQRSISSEASLRRDIAALRTEQATSDVVLSVAQTYGRVVTAQAARRAADAAIESAREDVARAERRRDTGIATDADVLSLRVHLADLEQRRIQADGDAAVARAELNHLMGAAISREYQVSEAVPPIEAPLEGGAPVAEALASRSSLKVNDAFVTLADRVRDGSRAALIPHVAAQAAVDISGNSFNDRTSSWVFGGELRWTFSTGGAELAHRRAAAEAASRARIEQEEARARVEVEVVSAMRRIETARAREAVGTASVEQARESQRIIRDRFEAGLAGTDEVLRSSAALLDAEARKTAATVDSLVGRALLDHAVGRKR